MKTPIASIRKTIKDLEYNIESYKHAVLLDTADCLKTISDLEKDKADCEEAILVLQNLSDSNNKPLVIANVSQLPAEGDFKH